MPRKWVRVETGERRLQSICGAVIPTKSEATPLRSVGAPLTQMFVLGWLPGTGSLLQGLTCPPLLTWQ